MLDSRPLAAVRAALAVAAGRSEDFSQAPLHVQKVSHSLKELRPLHSSTSEKALRILPSGPSTCFWYGFDADIRSSFFVGLEKRPKFFTYPTIHPYIFQWHRLPK